MTRKRWIVHTQDDKIIQELVNSLNISSIAAKILINRGITSVKEAREFLTFDLDMTPDPFLMLGMEKAVNRIKQALDQGESIVIYGDYDADGQTSTALLVRAFRELSKIPESISYYLPDRLHEGYGLHKEALLKLSKITSLIITVDCGISSIEEIEYANKLGMDIIVSDHHEPGPTLPPALAILNPKQADCPYPHKNLAGVGVAYKLVQALGLPKNKWKSYLDIVSLGTVADLVPLKGENRVWVHHGLKQLENTNNVGLIALLDVSGVKKPTAGHLGFRLGPRLNAVGRLGDSTRGVRLLLTEDPKEAKKLACELDAENTERQELEQTVLKEAEAVVEKYDLHKRSALVVWGESWHQGVVGIVASRLVERYYLPTIVISVQDGQGTASARSIEGLDLYKTLTKCELLLTQYGGHPMAAGLSLPEENLLLFQQEFEKICSNTLSEEDYVPKIYLDGTIDLGEITFDLIKELELLEPHGISNPSPTLQTHVSITRTHRVGQEGRHLQLAVRDQSCLEMSGIAFGFGEEEGSLEKYAESIDLAFVPKLHEWNKKKSIQLQVKAWKSRNEINNFIHKWMIEEYPWRLPASYFQSKAISDQNFVVQNRPDFTFVDLRGVWGKHQKLMEKHNLRERILILVNTPAKALEVCRYLRIQVPGGEEVIGFEHEYLTEEERIQLQKEPPYWLVSTGLSLNSAEKWSSVWLWEPPLNKNNYLAWTNHIADGGELIGVFGPKDLRAAEKILLQAYPERKGLAKIYSMLRRTDGKTSLDWASEQLETAGLLGALPFASNVFLELNLWTITENEILYLPAPDRKLDLKESVLYNNIMKVRKQSLEYLKHCLERGFFQDGLKRKD